MTYVSNIEDALEGANVCFIFTEWGEIKAVTPETYKKIMRTPLVYDGRNIYEVHLMKEARVEYHSIGREPAIREAQKESKNHELQTVRY
jgi:UDPglucose 6-dehydrogenase